MAACGNEEGLTGLDNCGGPKEGDEGAVMRIDFLVQTRGASESIQNTADRLVSPCYRVLVPPRHSGMGPRQWGVSQGNHIAFMEKLPPKPCYRQCRVQIIPKEPEQWKCNRKRASHACHYWIPNRECKPTGICCLLSCQSQMWQLGPLATVKRGKPRQSKCQDCQQHN